MIVSKTPLRISFCGGGTDMPCFYNKEPGVVLSWTIDKYVYISANKKFDSRIRVAYSTVEVVDQPEQVINELVRNTLLYTGITDSVEVSSISDVPAGTGLGSSSAYTIGLLKSLGMLKKRYFSCEQVADIASMIEIEMCGSPIGKQDQYACAFGGLNLIEFKPNGVKVNKIFTSPSFQQDLEDHLMLVWTGKTRYGSEVLKEQSETDNHAKLKYLKSMTLVLAADFVMQKHCNLGTVLHENWIIKKQLATKITSTELDDIYNLGLDNGAEGGKLLGAGGGGFFLFYVKPRNKSRLKEAFGNNVVDFKFTNQPACALEI